jgi:peroxiredoxin
MFKWFCALTSWQRYLAVSVLSFPLALGIRLLLQQVLPEDLAGEAIAVVRAKKDQPLSDSLTRILADDAFVPHPSRAHPLLGKRAPDFTLPDHTLKPVSLAELQGQGPVILVFYYGYYCGHCVAQLFALNEDLKLFEELGVHVVAVSPDTPEATAKQLAKYGEFSFPLLSDRDHQVAQAYGMFEPATAQEPERQAHATFLIGKGGDVFWLEYGAEPFLDNKTLLHVLARHLKISPR